MNRFIFAIIAFFISISFSSCNHKESTETSTNAVYFWKSWVNLSDAEQNFLTDNNVDKVYLRFFDIRDDFRFGPVPDAEVGIYQSDFPNGTDIVPCVFITLEAIEDMSGREKEFAMKIFDRIEAKCKNGNLSFNEIQLDCDWTESTSNTFFTLCKELKALTSAYDKKLSATIRLHQLSQPSPDVDKGVLMVYNVGELKNSKETTTVH